MAEKTKNIIAISIVVLIFGAILLMGYSGITGRTVITDEVEESFAECLTEKGAIMYGTEWCGFCTRQKDLFGSSFKHINYIDCDTNSEECRSAGVSGYPNWKINGENYPGLKQLSELSILTGCSLD